MKKKKQRLILSPTGLAGNKTFFFPDTKTQSMSEDNNTPQTHELRECIKPECKGPFMANIEKNETVCPRCVEIANLEDNGC